MQIVNLFSLIRMEYVLLYFSILITIYLYGKKVTFNIGAMLIPVSLLFFDLPDINEYRLHYELAGQYGYKYVFPLYNFEPGYVGLASVFSLTFPFEVFYIFIIYFSINAYLKFYNGSNSIYIALMLSLCLYFIAFTIRTTIASAFLAYALFFLRDGKILNFFTLIVIGALFHIVILPMAIFVIIIRFSKFISRHYIYLGLLICVSSIFIVNNLTLAPFVGLSAFVDFKILAYEEANVSAHNLFSSLWIFVFFASLISLNKRFNEFDRVLFVYVFSIILLSSQFGFLQGRFMWLTAFLFAYFFAKTTISRIKIAEFGRIALIITLPLLALIRM